MQPSDNELDKLIREAAEQYHATGTNADWEQMQRLLDQHMPVRKGNRRRLFFLLTALFLLAGGTYLHFNIINKNIPISVSKKKALKKTATPVISKDHDPVKEIKTGFNKNRRQQVLLKNIVPKQQQRKNAPNRNTHPKNNIAGKSEMHTYPGEITENNLPIPKGDESNSPVNKHESVHSNDDSVKVSITPNKNTIDSIKSTELTIPAEFTVVPDKTIADTSHIASNKKSNAPQNRKHPVEFTLLYAPELTTIGFSNIDKPGSNYGLLVGYQIFKNFTLQTGIIKSRKNYIANGYDFVLPYPLPANHTLKKVTGYCHMYEIPLMVKSNILSRKNSNVFYQAGISSYFMTREFYTYQWVTSNGGYNRSVQNKSQKNYWFSLATIGIGFEKEISKKIKVGATPFVKIPFKGMGTGELKLLGTGINFSLSYRPLFTR